MITNQNIIENVSQTLIDYIRTSFDGITIGGKSVSVNTHFLSKEIKKPAVAVFISGVKKSKTSITSGSNVSFIDYIDEDGNVFQYFNGSKREIDVSLIAYTDSNIESYKMEDILNEVDLVVLPSYREGLPRILLEAAAYGLPIVTTDAPGCREIVADDVNGFLVPCKDSAALATAIQRILDNPEERARMGAASRSKVLAEFDQKIVLRETFDVYRELLDLPE